MRVLDLFSGIGGFSLGLERAGMRTVAFCEIDPYCRAVLRKHWPQVPCFEDVRDLHAFDLPLGRSLTPTSSIHDALHPSSKPLPCPLGSGRVPLQALLGQPQLIPLGFPVVDWRTPSRALGGIFHGSGLCTYK